MPALRLALGELRGRASRALARQRRPRWRLPAIACAAVLGLAVIVVAASGPSAPRPELGRSAIAADAEPVALDHEPTAPSLTLARDCPILEQPRRDAAALGELRAGEPAVALGATRYFWRVDAGGRAGFIAKRCAR